MFHSQTKSFVNWWRGLLAAEKLDIVLDKEKLLSIFNEYIESLIEIANLFPNDIVRVMTSYPSGSNHYVMKKRHDEVWEEIETADYTLLTKFTKMNTRMVSVFFNKQKGVDKYIDDVIIALRHHQNIEANKNAVVALVYAGPKFRLEKHVDSKGLVRYHTPLIVSRDSYFETFDPYKKHFPKPGEVWRLETHLLHAAQNDDDEKYRIHCIIDFLE